MQFIITIIYALLVFGAVIFIHELGHFAVAKWSGIRVNEFAIGMGPTLFKFVRGETKYALRLLPIGGFVSMEGEDEESSDNRSFTNAPVHKRILVIIAGATMNFVLGFLALVVIIASNPVDIASNIVSKVEYSESGLKEGDKITHINGRRIFVMNDIMYEFARTQNGTFNFTVKRDKEKVELNNITFPVEKAIDADTGEFIIDDSTGKPYETLKLGFYVLPVQKNILTVVSEAFRSTLSFGRIIYLSLFDLIAGRVPVNKLSGPVGIVSEIGKAAKIGWRSVLNWMALISINLGVVNMLPLPALDGGKALLLIVEGIRRKPMNRKLEIAINMFGFAMLMLLMLFVSVNDIIKLIF